MTSVGRANTWRTALRLVLVLLLLLGGALMRPAHSAHAEGTGGVASTFTLIQGSGQAGRPDFTSMWRQGPDQINVVAYPTSLMVDATHGGLGLRLEERITFGSPDDQGFAPGMHVEYAPHLVG